ncbi:MAG: DUF1883 domain-containing protein [Candidatus Alkaliphilus sp. MAG34]
MDYIYYDLGFLNTNNSIKIVLDKQANVILLDDLNYQHYKNGRSCNCYGVLVKQSPFIMAIPNYAHWNLVINLGGASGQLKHSVEIIG